MRRRRMASSASIAHWTAWTPPNARRRDCSSGALKLSLHIGLDEIRADEFRAMPIIGDERDLLEREMLSGQHAKYLDSAARLTGFGRDRRL
jgi:hypothetical protein